jgi:transposase/arginine repressor
MTKSQNNNPFAKQKLDANLLSSLQQKGFSERAIVTELQKRGIKTSKSTVHRRLGFVGGAGCNSKKSGQQDRKKLNNLTRRYLVRQVRVHNEGTTKQLTSSVQQLGYDVCPRTVYRALQSVPTLRLRRPKKVTFLLPRHKTARRQWVQACLDANTDWTKVWFADEKLWYIDGPAHRPEIWEDTRDGRTAMPTKGRRNTSVCVFGAISLGGVSKLLVVDSHFNWQQYCQTVKAALPPTRRFQGHTLYHDRNPPHVNKQTQQWMAEQGIDVVLLPPKSADLNPIENVWAIMSREVYGQTATYNNNKSLQAAIMAAWARVQENRLLRRKLVGSMTERLRAVVAAKGGRTKF